MGYPVLARDDEIEALGQALSRAGAGTGTLVAVEGPAGIGRTRLLELACDRARADGWLVLDARCTPQSPRVPWSVPVELFQPVRERLAGDEAALLQGLPRDGRPVGEVVHAARNALESLTGDQPVVLVIDDLQWADSASLELLDLLVATVHHLRCLLLFAVRTGERVAAAEPLARLVASSTVLRPRPLTAQDVAVLQGLAEPDPRTDLLVDLTGGVPFLVHELLADATHLTPETVVASTLGRLARISPTAPLTARSAIVLEGRGDRGTVAALSGLPATTAADDLDGLIAAGLLSPDLKAESRLVAQAVLAHTGAGTLAELRRRAAQLLRRRDRPPAQEREELLTSAERRVADLVVRGLSNRQVAEQLVVTVKAVEWHLSNVYRKLGIRSRRELPGAIDLLDPAPAVPSPRHPDR